MSFGSPVKIFSPNNTNQNLTKSFSSFPNNMPMSTSQIPMKPGAVSMGVMINNVALKTYTDFHQLVDLLPSKDDVDKKMEIAKFLSRTRNLLIRLQALNKWTPSAQKVDKCEKISNLLDEQSSFLIKTAEDLSILANDKLPFARLQNILPITSVDIFATKTYSRLPNQIKISVLRSQKINKLDKIRMFNELDRILRIRLSNSKIPYRMRNIDISNGRVTFTVPDEFTVTCTLTSDHFDHPWKLLNVNFLVKGNNICRGRSLIHINHLKAMHEIIQTRLNLSHMDSRPSLYHLYDMMHSMSVLLQLEVLYEQLNDYIRHGHGIQFTDIRYIRGSKLSFSYWHRNEKYSQRPKHTISINVDEEDARRPLKIRHNPVLSTDNKYTEKILNTANLSIKDIIAESLVARIFSTLKIVQRLFFPLNNSQCISGPNPVLLIPVLTGNNQNNNCIKIQVHPANGVIKTTFEMPFDFMNRFQENKISKILFDLDNNINELLMKSFASTDIFDAKKIINMSENREVINHRRNIASSMNKLRIILTKYECLSVLQRVGFKDLHLFLNRPPICREKTSEAGNRNPIYQLFDDEAKGECELLFVQINNEWNYFIVVVCETKHRMVPNYRVFMLSTSKVFTVGNTAPYCEKMWVLRPVKLTPIPGEIIRKITKIKFQNVDTNEIRRNLKRESVTTGDLLGKIHAKQRKTEHGAIPSQDSGEDEYSGQWIITALPSIIGYMKDNVIFKLLLHEMDRRSISFDSERISEEIFVHSCQIKKFPGVKNCSVRAASLMNKMLMHCSVTYVARPQLCDATSHVRWEAELFMRSPFALLDKCVRSTNVCSKKFVLCSKNCLEENRTGIKEAVEKLMTFWEELCQFGDCFLLPLFDNQQALGTDFKLVSYQFTESVLSYGNDHQYQVVVSYSTQTGFRVSPEISASHMNRVTLTNPHILIKKDLENYLNSHKNIVVLIKMLSDTLEFLTYVYPFSNSTLMVIQDCNSTQLLRNYSLIVLDAYHVVLVFRERFALNIVLNNETHTVQLSDAHKNFHACNMSIKEMPLFEKFMLSLEEAYQVDIEVDRWPGLFVDQLAALLGNHSATSSRSSPTLLENYLLSALQLGAHDELFFPLPCGKEAKTHSGAELQVQLVSRVEKNIPFWELQMNVRPCDSLPPGEGPWLMENDMFTLANTVFESKIRAPKQSESGLNMFKKLLQLPSFSLQQNLFKILTQPPTVVELDSRQQQLVSAFDLDWANLQEAISQPQEPSSIVLRFILNIRIYQSGSTTLDQSVNLPLVLHYAVKSNQIATLPGTHPAIQRQGLDKDANSLLVGKINGDTPLLSFVGKLMANVKEYLLP